jgi:hypothetical protein
MKRYDQTYRFAEIVLRNLGFSSAGIAEVLTEEMVQHLAGCTAEQQKLVFSELNEKRLRQLEEDDDIPLVMKSADFRCSNEECGAEMRDEIVDVPQGLPLSRVTMECVACGADAQYFIPHGTRMAVQGEENVPKERLDAARRGLIRNPPPGFEPYRGDGSRRDIESWERKHNISAMSADEGRRGNATVNSKTKFTKSAAFEQALAEEVTRATEIAEAGGDRLAEAKAAIGRPNDFDVDAFKAQANVGVVEGSMPVADGAVPIDDVAEELTTVQRANQSRNQIVPEQKGAA